MRAMAHSHAMPPLVYHESELRLISDLNDPKRIVPNYPCRGWSVLDVGCGIGQTLVAPEFSEAAELHGIDIDPEAVSCRLLVDREPRLHLSCAPGESLPYESERFELVFSRVALPYTNIPVALREIYRVLKPGGYIWLTLHPWGLELTNIYRAAAGKSVRRLINGLYVLANSAAFFATGTMFARPWNGTYESVQTQGGIRRALAGAGFGAVRTERTAYHLVASGRKTDSAVHAGC